MLLSIFFSFSISAYYRPLTYYSMIKLEHNMTKRYLSASQLSYEGGSHQMLTRASTKDYLAESIWTILPQNFSLPDSNLNKIGPEYLQNNHIHQGDRIKCNDIVQLYHTTSRGFLHTHDFWSLLGKGFEVTSFPEVDKGNWWSVRCLEDSDWPVFGHSIKLQHVIKRCSIATDQRSSLPPQNGGQFELYCSFNTHGPELSWKLVEGIFIDEQDTEEDEENEEDDKDVINKEL